MNRKIPLIGFVSTVLAAISLVIACFVRFRPDGEIPDCAYFVLGFWVIAPPVWFLFEYFYWPPNGTDEVDKIKHLHDLARNIWVALVVILAAIMGVKWPITP